jgi:DNA-binding HxlR family transcriptional regulator
MASTVKRSVCPIACVLDLLGDKWTLLIIRDMMGGKSRFQDFLKSPEGIATNVLADRLAKLVEHRLVETKPSPERAGALVYSLTEKGSSLRPLLEAIRDWGLGHIKGTAAHIRA